MLSHDCEKETRALGKRCGATSQDARNLTYCLDLGFDVDFRVLIEACVHKDPLAGQLPQRGKGLRNAQPEKLDTHCRKKVPQFRVRNGVVQRQS